MRAYTNIWRIPEEEEVLFREFDDGEIMENKLQEGNGKLVV